MSKLVQKTQLSGALNEVCDLVHSRKVASAGAIEDCKSQMEWYNVHDRLRQVTGELHFPWCRGPTRTIRSFARGPTLCSRTSTSTTRRKRTPTALTS